LSLKVVVFAKKEEFRIIKILPLLGVLFPNMDEFTHTAEPVLVPNINGS